MSKKYHTKERTRSRTSWDPLAEWYNGWVGKHGSKHHQKLAIPAVLRLLNPKAGMHVLEIGAGQGVLAPYIAKRGAIYTGLEISDKLIYYARKHHSQHGRFIRGDARQLDQHPQLTPNSQDAVVFMLSIQNMEPLGIVLQNGSKMLKPGGRMILLLMHPCFRVPRQSGWGWDENRRLHYRRVDRYLGEFAARIRPPTAKKKGTTLNFHRPLAEYVNGLGDCGLLIDRLAEIPGYQDYPSQGKHTGANNLSNQEIPLFLGIRACKVRG